MGVLKSRYRKQLPCTPFCRGMIQMFFDSDVRRRRRTAHFSSTAAPSRRRMARFLLALAWVFGLLSGILLFHFAGTPLLPLMRRAAVAPVSITGLLTVSLIPFLITALAVSLFRSAIFPLCFLKAFLFAFCAAGIASSNGPHGWLYGRMTMASQWMLLPVLYLLWLRLLPGSPKISRWEAAGFVFAALLIVFFHHCIVSPVWAALINYEKGYMGISCWI